jgi:hypothetical protein
MSLSSHAPKAKPTVVFTNLVYADGIGDFKHLISLADPKILKKLNIPIGKDSVYDPIYFITCVTGKQLEIIRTLILHGMMEDIQDNEEKSTSTKDNKEYIEKVLSVNPHVHICSMSIENIPKQPGSLNDSAGQTKHLAAITAYVSAHPELKIQCEQAALTIAVSTPCIFDRIILGVQPEVMELFISEHEAIHRQLRSKIGINSNASIKPGPNLISQRGMGRSNGILLKEPPLKLSAEERFQYLQTIKDDNYKKIFSSNYMSGEDFYKNNFYCVAYSQEDKPGSKESTSCFATLMIYSELAKAKNIILHLPKGTTLSLELAISMGFTELKTLSRVKDQDGKNIISQDKKSIPKTHPDQPERTLSLISNYYLDDEDYQKISESADVFLASGDNTFQESQALLNLYQIRAWKEPFSQVLNDIMLENGITKEFSELFLIIGHAINFGKREELVHSTIINLLQERSAKGIISEIGKNILEEMNKTDLSNESRLDLLYKILGKMLNENAIEQSQLFRKILFEKFNFYEKLPGFINAGFQYHKVSQLLLKSQEKSTPELEYELDEKLNKLYESTGKDNLVDASEELLNVAITQFNSVLTQRVYSILLAHYSTDNKEGLDSSNKKIVDFILDSYEALKFKNLGVEDGVKPVLRQLIKVLEALGEDFKMFFLNTINEKYKANLKEPLKSIELLSILIHENPFKFQPGISFWLHADPKSTHSILPEKNLIKLADFMKPMSSEDFQKLRTWCNTLGNPIKISKKEIPEHLSRFINSSIFVDPSGEIYALFEGKDEAFKHSKDSNNKTISQVKWGKKINTNERVIFKIETLPTPQEFNPLFDLKKNLIDNEVQCGKLANSTQSSAYLNNKHYQILTWAEGDPLIEPNSTLQINRFDISKLDDTDKFEIAIKIIEQLKVLHFTSHVLHRDLYGDNIIVNRKDNNFSVAFVDYGMSVPLKISEEKALYYIGPTADYVHNAIENFKKGVAITYDQGVYQTVKYDIQRAFSSILTGLGVKNKTLFDALQNFVRRRIFTEQSYSRLISDLRSLQPASKTDEKEQVSNEHAIRLSQSRYSITNSTPDAQTEKNDSTSKINGKNLSS